MMNADGARAFHPRRARRSAWWSAAPAV